MIDKDFYKQTREYIEKLIAAADEARVSDIMQEWLEFCSLFWAYSFNNQRLIKLQRPEATMVMGRKQWLERHKRTLKFQQRNSGIVIYAPIFRWITNDEDERVKVLRGFRPVLVYDVEQTEGPDLPPEPDWKGNIRAPWLENMLIAWGQSQGISVTTMENRGPVGVSMGGGIAYVDDFAVPRTIGHELGHELLRKWKAGYREEESISRDMEECIVDAAATVMLLHFGVDVSSTTSTYIAMWSKDSKEIISHMELVQRVARELINGVETTINGVEQ